MPIETVQKGKLRKELNIPDNMKIIGNVARLDRPKNPMRFLEIAEKVLKERNDVVFVWIGGNVVEDYYAKQVEQYLSEKPLLKEKVKVLGFRKDATELMSDFDLFLLTSDDEGMPLVILEAQQLGIPVVSTDVGCVSEMDAIVLSNDNATEKIRKALLNDFRYTNNTVSDLQSFIKRYVGLYK